MIDESGAVVPDPEEINVMVDDQWKLKANKEKWQKCGQCDFYGNWEQMEFHRLGQHNGKF